MAEVNDNSSIQLFEDQKIRTAWDAEKEEWYFAIVDVIAVLTDSADPQNYWRVLKKRLKDEGNETITNCNGLKMTAPDGKKRKTDVANTEQLLRIIQSIPSPILSITLQQVDAAPDTQGTAQTDHDGLQSIDCAVEKFHKVLTFCRLFCGTQK